MQKIITTLKHGKILYTFLNYINNLQMLNIYESYYENFQSGVCTQMLLPN